MRAIAFRITSFRSIEDTGWVPFSSDGITALVGQNESGKTSVLEALGRFQGQSLGRDDLRSPMEWPAVSLRLEIQPEEFSPMFPDQMSESDRQRFILDFDDRVDLTTKWVGLDSAVRSFSISLEQYLDGDILEVQAAEQSLIDWLYRFMPQIVVFENRTGVLPDSVPLSSLVSGDQDTTGVVGARNLMAVAGLSPERLIETDKRLRDNEVSRANRRLNQQLRTFWKQKIGERLSVSLEAEVDQSDGDLRLYFWVKDGDVKYYPHQRSEGLRWFISFFLQMLAEGESDVIYLIDEPGANLHAIAQRNVLELFEKIRTRFPVVYSTHSPYLVDTTKIGRVLAVQREEAEDDRCPTRIYRASDFARMSESRDTLSPIYTAMGVDFSHQDVVGRQRNLVLEELSAYYYLHAFYSLLETAPPHIIPANGADAVPIFAGLLFGWGLGFSVLLDGDSKGREIRDKIRAATFAADSAEAERRVLVLQKAACIEELFAKPDVKKHILRDKNAHFDSVCEAMKGKSKALLALSFFNDVQSGAIAFESLHESTQKRIGLLIDRIERSFDEQVAQ